MLTQIHEYKGEQASILADKAEMLAPLAEMARVQSTEASNRMEGVSASDSRIRKLVLDKTTLRTRDERKIAGYRDVLAAVQENYAYLPPKTSVILQMYHDLGKYSGGALGGIYRSTDGGAGEEGTPGRRISPQSVPAEEIPQAMERLCASFDEALRNPVMDPLLLTPLFVLDFLCIQPFHGGNGPMSRLLTLLLLDRAGYLVGNYISLEKRIEETREAYDKALRRSSAGWREERNRDIPFVGYVLETVLASYRELSRQIQRLTVSGVSKPDRVREMIKGAPGRITKAEILEGCSDISQVTVQRALMELRKSGEIIKLGGGRYTAYIWNRERK